MSCDHVAVATVQTVKSTCSQSNHSRISVELNSHAVTCVVGSNVLVIHDHEHFVDIYSFDKETCHANACTVDAAIAYKDPVTHSTVILMINQAIKINSMHNILVCPLQCCVHVTTVNESPKFLSASPSEHNHALLAHDPTGCSPPLTILLTLNGVTSYFEARCPSLAEYEDDSIPKYHLTSESPPWDHSTSLYSSQEDRMVDYRGCLISKLSTDPHSPDMVVGSVVLPCTRLLTLPTMRILLQS